MVQIQLQDTEAQILRSVLENDVADLSMEISNTDAQQFRDLLKQRQQVLNDVIEQLGGAGR